MNRKSSHAKRHFLKPIKPEVRKSRFLNHVYARADHIDGIIQQGGVFAGPKTQRRVPYHASSKTTPLPDSHPDEASTSHFGWSLIGLIILLPICYHLSEVFLTLMIQSSSSEPFWRSANVFAFTSGGILAFVWFFLLPRPTVLYVLGHELTHAFFVLLCRGKILDFKFSARGGYVATNKSNTLIILSPYFVPFYSIVVLILFGGYSLFKSLSSPIPLGFIQIIPIIPMLFLLGLTWFLHLIYTVWMLRMEQPDLKDNGGFFSLSLIYLINLMVATLVLMFFNLQLGLASSPRDFFSLFQESVMRVWPHVIQGLREVLFGLG